MDFSMIYTLPCSVSLRVKGLGMKTLMIPDWAINGVIGFKHAFTQP